MPEGGKVLRRSHKDRIFAGVCGGLGEFFWISPWWFRLAFLIALLPRAGNPGCRRSLFESLDKPALKPLPETPYIFAEWKKARVHIDYHIEVDGHYYSVPYHLVKHELDVRFTKTTVEVFHKGCRVASHVRSYQRGGHATLKEHMPTAHRFYADWSPERLIRWAAKTATATAKLVEVILSSRVHPAGLPLLFGHHASWEDYGAERLEAACARALLIGGLTYKSVKAILTHGLDQRPLPEAPSETETLHHENVRGPNYYH